MHDKQTLLDEETFLVRHSGEIPEVAYHGSIYYLTEDGEGPRLELGPDDYRLLKDAVAERYCAIIRRDLHPDNRDRRRFRGMLRCLANWQRLCRFCRQEGRDMGQLKMEINVALTGFLRQEYQDVTSGRRQSCISCSAADLVGFVAAVGVAEADLPSGWQQLCCR